MLWEVWRWPLTETQSRLRHVCLHCSPTTQCTWTSVSLKIHTPVLASIYACYASMYTFCITGACLYRHMKVLVAVLPGLSSDMSEECNNK